MAEHSPIKSEFETSEQEAAYDLWFRAKVEAAMASKQPGIPHEEAMAKMQTILDGHKSRPRFH